MDRKFEPWADLGLLAASLVVSFGTAWAFLRGANDFNVFYHAWSLVLSGKGAEIYRNTPDRFLYAPGFAWIFAPIAFLGRDVALALWCFLKAAALGWMIREFSMGFFGRRRSLSRRGQLMAAGICAWAVALVARPILIDFQYGQVNLLILAACAWALCRYFDPERDGVGLDVLSWACFGIAAAAKIYPAAIALVPFFVAASVSPRKRAASVAGLAAGVALTLLVPMISQGWAGALALYPQWKTALLNRGLPLESHNQSFVAFLYHYTSGLPTEVIAQNRRQFALGLPLVSTETITLLAAGWAFAFLGLLAGWILQGPSAKGGRAPGILRYAAVAVALMILPSHLVWKPYFVMTLPIAMIAIFNALKRPVLWPVIAVAFALDNLTGFDFVGGNWSAHFEGASVMLWAHLLILFAASTRSEFAISAKRPYAEPTVASL